MNAKKNGQNMGLALCALASVALTATVLTTTLSAENNFVYTGTKTDVLCAKIFDIEKNNWLCGSLSDLELLRGSEAIAVTGSLNTEWAPYAPATHKNCRAHASGADGQFVCSSDAGVRAALQAVGWMASGGTPSGSTPQSNCRAEQSTFKCSGNLFELGNTQSMLCGDESLRGGKFKQLFEKDIASATGHSELKSAAVALATMSGTWEDEDIQADVACCRKCTTDNKVLARCYSKSSAASKAAVAYLQTAFGPNFSYDCNYISNVQFGDSIPIAGASTPPLLIAAVLTAGGGGVLYVTYLLWRRRTPS